MNRDIVYYRELPQVEVGARIEQARSTLGDRLIILGHHYQLDEVIQHVDFTGDSYQLAKKALTCSSAEFIVFCGVHFMAETADIVTDANRKVILPVMDAGCPMADMATYEHLKQCWKHLLEMGLSAVPVTYMNSSAEIKAFCGEHGGAVCTSSNAASVFSWALKQGDCILFTPDEHLGRNTGREIGIPENRIAKWLRSGHLEASETPRLVVWDGYCPVHQRFSEQHVQSAREIYASVNVAVHPECPDSVVKMSDKAGSTEQIIQYIKESPSGSTWMVGTEKNLVERLAKTLSDRKVLHLAPDGSVCEDMSKVRAYHLCWVLENLVEGRLENQVRVPHDVAVRANLAIQRMLQVS